MLRAALMMRQGPFELRLLDLDVPVLKATSQIPIGFGIQEDDAKEFRPDPVYPRAWRKATQQASSTGLAAIRGMIISP
jgi:hypothetical protein